MQKMPKHNTDNEHEGAEEVFLDKKEEPKPLQGKAAEFVAGLLVVTFGAILFMLMVAAGYRAFLWIWP